MDEVEKNRAEELRLRQQRAAREQKQAAPQGPEGVGSLNELARSDNSQGSDESSGPGGAPLPEGSRPMEEEPATPSPRRREDNDEDEQARIQYGRDADSNQAGRRETLRANTMKAALAMLAADGQAEGAGDDPIAKQTSKLNHWMLEAEVEMLASDFSTIGLSLCVTLPTRIVFCSVLALELKHAFSGSKSMIPYFPTLTFGSFYPPMTDPPDFLPNVLLQVAVLAYIMFIVLITIILVGLVTIALTALGSAARSGVFSIAKTLFGL